MIGLDIGYKTLKLVSVKKRGRSFHLISYNEVPIPPACLQKNGIKDRNKISLALKQALHSAKPKPISETQASGSLPESLVFTKILTLPQLQEQELAKAVPYEAASALPVSKEEVYLDWHVLGSTPGQTTLDVLVAAAPKTLIDQYLAIIKEVGLQLLTLETKPISISRATISDSDLAGVASVDIGAQASSISIFDSSAVRLTSTVASGAEAINKLLATEGVLKEAEIEAFKREKGFTKATLKEKQLLSQALSPIIQEVQNSIKYYQNRIKAEQRISKIKLCGGGAALPGIVDFFQKETGISSEIGNPLVHITAGQNLIPKAESLKYTVAIGAALRED